MGKSHTSRKMLRLGWGELKQLADEAGVTPSHLRHYLAGRRDSARLDEFLREKLGVDRSQVEGAAPRKAA